MNMIIFSFAWSSVKNNCQNSVKTCYEVLKTRNLHHELRRQIFTIAQYMECETIEFCAWGFFTISRSVLCSLVNSCITYVIIILQIQHNEKL